jgi:CheY-like chemotaxis protein
VTRTLLVVDDDINVRHLVRRVVHKDFDAELLEAEQGLAAIDVLMNTRVDLVLLDISMPIMDGVETLGAIRRIPQLAGLPAMILAGKAEEDQVQQLIGLGIAGFLVKPFRPSLLRERLSAILARVPAPPALPARPRIGGLALHSESQVLLLDDSPEFREVFAGQLTPLCRVAVADGVSDALERCSRDQYDCVFVGSLGTTVQVELFARKARLASQGAPIVALASAGQRAAVEATSLYEFTILRSFLPHVLRAELRHVMAPHTIARWVLAPTGPAAHSFGESAALPIADLLGRKVDIRESSALLHGRRVRAALEVQANGLSWRLSLDLPYASALPLAEATLKQSVDQLSDAHVISAARTVATQIGEALAATTGMELALELTPPAVEITDRAHRGTTDDEGARRWCLGWSATDHAVITLAPLAQRSTR